MPKYFLVMGAIFVSKRKPRQKQAEALAKLEGKQNFALLMAQRTGKTKVICDDWQRQVHVLSDLLVIAPAGVYRTWETALCEDINDRLLAQVKVFTWISDKREDPKPFLKYKGPRVLLMNIEALSVLAAAQELCKEFLERGTAIAVIDESVTIKNPAAARTKFTNTCVAPRAAARRILSGLPTPRSILDLFSQFEFLNPRILNYENYYAFRAHFAHLKKLRIGGRTIRIVTGYRNQEELANKIAPHIFRVRLEDCYDMPLSSYAVREVPMTKEQRRIYGEIKQFATAKLSKGRHVTALLVITQMLRLHQVLCGHVVDDDRKSYKIEEYRTTSLLELLDDYAGKAVIWCGYDEDIHKISNALAQEYEEEIDPETGEKIAPVWPNKYVSRFWGGNRKTREKEEKTFKTDPKCRFMVATAAAGRFGRNWDCADLVVYYSNSPDLDYRMQSEERVKNVGKTRPIAYVDMVTKGTVDEKILQALRAKIDMAATITGDSWKEWVV